MDYIAVAKFDQHFRSMSASEFADLLKDKLNAQALVLGDDFHFGKDRQGNSEFLKNYGFQVTNLHTIELEGERVSSTRIRQVLQVGNLALAAKLLGRPYSITGRVQYGDQIGRTLDFPTINVRLNRHKPCLNGIYGVEVICETTSLTQKCFRIILKSPELPDIMKTASMVQVMSVHVQPFSKNIQSGD